MKNWKSMVAMLPGLSLLVFMGVVGLVTVESAGLVDWRNLRAVTFQSDDWGLAGFVPSADVWLEYNREEFHPGRFPEVYWESTLEDSLMVSRLCDIMASVWGSDGLPAVFQPNYVLSSLSYEKGPTGYVWNRYDWPQLPTAYQRPGLLTAVQHGIDQGLWYPEFHATWHYDPTIRLEVALSSDISQKLTKAGVTLFPGSEKAWELAPWRSTKDLNSELFHSSRIFENAFGRPIGSVMAPDYIWDDRIEAMWQAHGIRVIQGKREQRDPTLLPGKSGRIQKYLKRKFDLLANRQRQYLKRNCRLEPVQTHDVDEVLKRCLADTRKAWNGGYPAIVETHRVNFAHSDQSVVQKGQQTLESYLFSICENPDFLPVFLVDTEIAQLQTRGVSWVVRGKQIILRNATHSRRLIAISSFQSKRVFMVAANSVVVTKW